MSTGIDVARAPSVHDAVHKFYSERLIGAAPTRPEARSFRAFSIRNIPECQCALSARHVPEVQDCSVRHEANGSSPSDGGAVFGVGDVTALEMAGRGAVTVLNLEISK